MSVKGVLMRASKAIQWSLRVCAKITSDFGGSATGPDARPAGGSVSLRYSTDRGTKQMARWRPAPEGWGDLARWSRGRACASTLGRLRCGSWTEAARARTCAVARSVWSACASAPLWYGMRMHKEPSSKSGGKPPHSTRSATSTPTRAWATSTTNADPRT